MGIIKQHAVCAKIIGFILCGISVSLYAQTTSKIPVNTASQASTESLPVTTSQAYLDAIHSVAPLLKNLSVIKEDIATLNTQMSDTSQAQSNQAERQKQLQQFQQALTTQQAQFNQLAQSLPLKTIQVQDVPDLLKQLGYEERYYDRVHSELLHYLGLINKTENASLIHQSLTEVNDTIEQTKQKQSQAKSDEEKKAIAEQLTGLVERKAALQKDFTLTVTGIDVTTLNEKKNENLNVEEEVGKIFSPVVQKLTELTEPSRHIAALRARIGYYEQHIPQIETGIMQIDAVAQKTQAPTIKSKLEEEKAFWQKQQQELSAKLSVSQQQLSELLNKKTSLSDVLGQVKQALLSKRSLNILTITDSVDNPSNHS